MSLTCNVQNTPPGLALEVIRDGGFAQYSAEELKVTKFVELEDQAIRLSTDSVPNAVTGFVFTEKERLGDGFRVEFDFSFDAGTADGFALVVQDDRVNDILGNPGASLGFEDVFPSYLAIGFDFCSDRPSCTEQTILINTREPSQPSQTIASISDTNLFGVLNNGTEFVTRTARIDYLDDLKQVHVFLGNQNLLIAEDIDLSTLFATKFAHIGFSGSNADSLLSNVNALNLAIESLDVTQMNSGFKMTDESLRVQIVDFGQVVVFEFDIVDSCNSPDVNATQLDLSKVTGVMQDRVQENNRVEFTEVTQSGSTVSMVFVTTAQVSAIYDVTIKVDDVLVQQNPLTSIVNAVPPLAEEGLPPIIIITIVGSLLLLILLLIVLTTRGYFRYKKKLDEHEEDIEYGKTKEQIDAIDETIDYRMNPLVAPLDKLKERLAKNLQYIEDIKAGQQNALDGEYTVEQLHAENEQLRQEIAEVKKQNEFANAGKDMSDDEKEEDFEFVPPPKLEFEPEQDNGDEEEETDSQVEATVKKVLSKQV